MISTIEDNSFKDLVNLTTLTLNTNKINSITANTFKGLFKLKNLIMENLNHHGSRQLKLADGAFSNLNDLEVLILNNNKMEHFTDDTFKGLNNLKSLNFQFGMVSSISSKAFDMFPASLLINNKGGRDFEVCCCTTAKALSRFPSVETSCKINACIETNDICNPQVTSTSTGTTATTSTTTKLFLPTTDLSPSTTSVIQTTLLTKSSVLETTNIMKEPSTIPVSYTHLTLPTIYSV